MCVRWWTGCGYSNAGFGTPVNPGDSYLDASGQPVACALDCPRTSVSYDDGNPFQAYTLTRQQKDRTVAFLFRERSNFTLLVRLEVGNMALGNTNNDLYDWQGNGPNLAGLDDGRSTSARPNCAKHAVLAFDAAVHEASGARGLRTTSQARRAPSDVVSPSRTH